MKATDFINIVAPFSISGISGINSSTVFTKITADSREVEEGTVFFCIKGAKSDGHDFIAQAVEKNAALIVGENELNMPSYLRVSSVKEVLKKISPLFYDHPDRKMKMVAVTGTNGKTSTTYIIEKMLQDKYSCGVTGTLGYRFNGFTVNAQNTTPLNWKWYSLLNEMKECETEVVISEVSSHAIEEERIEITKFDIAVFTNLSRDHLDFHGDIENYYQAKKKLFIKHLKDGGTAVINYDDLYGKRLYQEIKELVKCIRISDCDPDAELRMSVEKVDEKGSSVKIKFNGKESFVNIPLIGKFNIYNALCGFVVCSLLAGTEHGLKMIETRVSVPGRLEKIENESIFIDYAHTPDALENVLMTIRNLNIFERIITVFGAGGDRDKGKRPLMGRIASQYSDIVILTDDNPRTEDPVTIIEEILNGCNLKTTVVEIINNRSCAIRKALELKRKKDVLIVAGKGAEDYQITSAGKRFFSDKLEIEKYLKELQNVHDKLN